MAEGQGLLAVITVYFSCKKCGLVKHPVQVPAREDPDPESVVYWMKEIVGGCISHEHDRVSPHCKIETISDVMIPMPPEAEFIGQQVE